MKTIITTTLPPPILQSFNKDLLSSTIRLGEDSDTLKELCEHIRRMFSKGKYRRFPNTIKALNSQYLKFMGIYEIAKEKEARNAKRIFYYHQPIGDHDGKIYKRLRKRVVYSNFQRKNNGV